MSDQYAPPRTFLKSRENLQELSRNNKLLEKYAAFDLVLIHLWYSISDLVSQKTHCIFNLNKLRIPSIITPAFISELIEVLKKEYPGVDFEYKETAGYDGKILERIILMDWS